MNVHISPTRARLPVLCAIIALGLGCGSAKERNPESGPPDLTTPPGGKNSGNDGGKKGTPMSTFEKVEAWARPGSSIGTFEDVKVPQMELFWVSWHDPNIHGGPTEWRGVAVLENATQWIEGKAAMREVLRRGISDAEQLARLSMLLLQGRGELQVGQTDTPAPERTQDTLTYYWRTDDSGRNLVRSSLDLATLELTTEPGIASDPFALAQEALATQGDIAAVGAISELATNHCADPRTVPLLLKTAAAHGYVTARAAAAAALGTCKAPKAVAPLLELLATDPEDSVRIGAATGLGEIGGAEVEAALRAASPKQSSNEVRMAISRAIKRIMAAQ